MSKKTIHALVRNRTRLNRAIKIETAKGEEEIAPNAVAEVVLTRDQFDILWAQQRDAVMRKEGALRLVDYWGEEGGKRVEVERPTTGS